MTKVNGEIKIEKGIPMPAAYQRYPWSDMEVGDSFLVQGKTAGRFSVPASTQQRLGFKFATRTIGNDVRVWRIE